MCTDFSTCWSTGSNSTMLLLPNQILPVGRPLRRSPKGRRADISDSPRNCLIRLPSTVYMYIYIYIYIYIYTYLYIYTYIYKRMK